MLPPRKRGKYAQYETATQDAIVGRCDCCRLLNVPLADSEDNTMGYFLSQPVICTCGAKHVTMRLPDDMLAERSLSEEERQRRDETNLLETAGRTQLEAIRVVSLPYIAGYEVIEQFDVISAEVVLGTGFMSEWGAAFADFFGDRATLMEGELETAKKAAIAKLKGKALLLNANAVLSVDIDYHSEPGDHFPRD